MAGNTIWSASSGSGPSESGKSRYWPGSIRVPGAAVQVTDPTVSVIVRPSSCTGGLSGTLLVVAVQPGSGVVRTELIGWSVGSVTVRPTVPAVSDSLGTRNVTTE